MQLSRPHPEDISEGAPGPKLRNRGCRHRGMQGSSGTWSAGAAGGPAAHPRQFEQHAHFCRSERTACKSIMQWSCGGLLVSSAPPCRAMLGKSAKNWRPRVGSVCERQEVIHRNRRRRVSVGLSRGRFEVALCVGDTGHHSCVDLGSLRGRFGVEFH